MVLLLVICVCLLVLIATALAVDLFRVRNTVRLLRTELANASEEQRTKDSLLV